MRNESKAVDVLAVMLKHPNFQGGFPTGTLCSMLQTAGGLVRRPSGNHGFPPRPKARVVLRELRKLEAEGKVVCLGTRHDVHPESCWKGDPTVAGELLWQPATPSALARVGGAA